MMLFFAKIDLVSSLGFFTCRRTYQYNYIVAPIKLIFVSMLVNLLKEYLPSVHMDTYDVERQLFSDRVILDDIIINRETAVYLGLSEEENACLMMCKNTILTRIETEINGV